MYMRIKLRWSSFCLIILLWLRLPCCAGRSRAYVRKGDWHRRLTRGEGPIPRRFVNWSPILLRPRFYLRFVEHRRIDKAIIMSLSRGEDPRLQKNKASGPRLEIMAWIVQSTNIKAIHWFRNWDEKCPGTWWCERWSCRPNSTRWYHRYDIPPSPTQFVFKLHQVVY